MSGAILDGLQQPSDFRLGSTESRAAARALLNSRMGGVPTVQLLGRFQGQDESALIIGPRHPANNGGFERALQIPTGTSEYATMHLLATP